MHRIAVKMKLLNGFEDEYQKRHDQIWPELKLLLKQNGINDYSIFLDPETNTLFAVLKVEDTHLLDKLAAEQIMQRWWTHMKDIMEINQDHSPVQIPLKEVFYMP